MIFDSPTSSLFIVRFHQSRVQDKAPRKDSQPSSTMRNWVMATLLALVVAVSAGVGYGVGYFVGSTSQSSTGRCTPVGSIGGSIQRESTSPSPIRVIGDWQLLNSRRTRQERVHWIRYVVMKGVETHPSTFQSPTIKVGTRSLLRPTNSEERGEH